MITTLKRTEFSQNYNDLKDFLVRGLSRRELGTCKNHKNTEL